MEEVIEFYIDVVRNLRGKTKIILWNDGPQAIELPDDFDSYLTDRPDNQIVTLGYVEGKFCVQAVKRTTA